MEAEYKAAVKAVQSGDETAKTKLAWFMLSGIGGAQVDADEAVVLLEERVRDRDAEAMWMLGICKEFGRGTDQDVEGAEELYRRSSEGENEVGKFLEKKKECGRGSGLIKTQYSLL